MILRDLRATSTVSPTPCGQPTAAYGALTSAVDRKPASDTAAGPRAARRPVREPL